MNAAELISCVHNNYDSSDYSICALLNQIDRITINSNSNGKLSRRKGRYLRRQIRRLQHLIQRNLQIGNYYDIFTFGNLYHMGKKSCNGVRWKQSTQNFELHLFSNTAKTLKDLQNNTYKFSKFLHFIIRERGKERPIDAPAIRDRQLEKLYTKQVLLPLYLPILIKNNGASLEGKGFHYSLELLKRDLRQHYKKHGQAGGILLTDGKAFFPSAEHQQIYNRHQKYILDVQLRTLGDQIIATSPTKTGLPLGVEVSQAEMVAYPTELDTYMTSTLGFSGYGHYMDDFYVLIPPNINYKDILQLMTNKAKQCGLTINAAKTKYIPLTKPFRYCKAKFLLTKTGKIIIRCNKTAMPRNRRKIKMFAEKIKQNKISYQDIYDSMNAMIAYLNNYNEYNNIRQLEKLFFNLFHFSYKELKDKIHQ